MTLRTLVVALAVLSSQVARAALDARPSPAPKADVSSPAGSSPPPGIEVGGFAGYETDDVSGLSLRLDGELPLRDVPSQVRLSLVASVGYSRLTDRVSGVELTADVLKIVPAMRFTLALNPEFSLFADAGLGLAYVAVRIENGGRAVTGGSSSDSTFNPLLRLGAGAWYHLDPRLKLGAMLEIDPMLGDFGFPGARSQSTVLLQAGAMFRL